MTTQEVFDKVWDHYIVKKNRGSFLKQEPNRYILKYKLDDKACDPIGLFIIPEKYNLSVENMPIEGVFNSNLLSCITTQDSSEDINNVMSLLAMIESAHDNAVFYDDFNKQFKDHLVTIASGRGINIPKEPEVKSVEVAPPIAPVDPTPDSLPASPS